MWGVYVLVRPPRSHKLFQISLQVLKAHAAVETIYETLREGHISCPLKDQEDMD